MARLSITQVRSRIGSTKIQRRNLDALGLRKMNQTVQHDDSPIILGMIEKVRHLVTIETIEAAPKKEAKPKKAADKPVKAVAEPVSEPVAEAAEEPAAE